MLIKFGSLVYEIPEAMAKLSDWTVANLILDSELDSSPFPTKPFSSEPPARVFSDAYVSGLYSEGVDPTDGRFVPSDFRGLIDSRVSREF